MDEKNIKLANIPYIVHEDTVTHLVKVIKWLIIALCISVLLMVASNLAWLYVFNSYDYTDDISTESVTVDGKDGVANYVGNDGDITNGTDYSNENESTEN